MSLSLFEKLAKKYPTPQSVQHFLHRFHYNRELKKETVRSAKGAYDAGEAHCLEACFLAAAILEHQGYPPLLLCMDSSDNVNHAVFLFKERSGWGAVGRSREPGLHGREPVFKSIQSLVASYADPFVDKTGSLIGYHIVSLDDTGADWRFSKRNVWKADHYIVAKPYLKINPSKARVKKLHASYLKNGPIPGGKFWW